MPRRSRWTLVIPLLVVAAVCVRLGIWQVHRLQARRAANARALAARAEPELDLAHRPAGAPVLERRVRATGTFDRAHEFVLRGQVMGVPGVELVTPLRLAGAGDTAVLVDRGFVPSPDAATLPDMPLDEPGELTVHGLALPAPSEPDSGQPLTNAGKTTWRRVDLAAARARLPYPVLDVVLLATPDSAAPRFPRRRPEPTLDDGPHLNYALQWFAFATMAVIFAGVMWRTHGLKRPRSRDPATGGVDG
ncbi:MAG TPA: SURF1 family protein [Gemmatimonadales bacterium]|nr:SURF1 family protein [Gemmatimonadales bacterium]